MAEPVNLNRFRKTKQREADKKQAAQNRIAFGRTKAEKQKQAREDERSSRDLDGKKID